jgi:hypothetical protein
MARWRVAGQSGGCGAHYFFGLQIFCPDFPALHTLHTFHTLHFLKKSNKE